MDKPASSNAAPIGRLWIVPAIVLTGMLWIGIGDLRGAGSDPALVESMTGATWEALQSEQPAVANLVDLMARLLGALWIGLSLLGLAALFGGYRRGRRWGWYGLWAVPAATGLIAAIMLTAPVIPGQPTPPAAYSAPVMAGVFVLSLLLPVRRFFR